MDADIRSKIKNVLGQKQFSEKDIVYFLVESYKFLERKFENDFGNGKYDRIKFYRNWASHAVLYGDSHKVFKKFDTLIKAELTKKSAHGHLDWQNFMCDKIRDCFRDYGLPLLKKDISDFFREIGYVETFSWESFRASLYEVIKEIPLAIKNESGIIFSFKCVTPVARLNYDDLSLEASIGGDTFTIVVNDRSL